MPRRPLRPAALGALSAALLVLPGCGEDTPEPTDPTVLRSKRELVAAYYEEDRLLEAEEVAAWVLARPEATPQDLVNAAAVDLAATRVEQDRAAAWIEEALRRDPDLATAWYCQGWLALLAGDMGRARDSMKRAMELRPDDAPARYQYASLSADLGDTDTAIRNLETILEGGIERVGSFYLSAENRLGFLLRTRSDDPADKERGLALNASFLQHKAEGWPYPQSVLLYRGYLGRVQPPPKPTGDGARADAPVELRFERTGDTLFAGAGPVVAALAFDLDVDRRPDVFVDRRLDVVALGEDAVHLARQREGARFEEEVLVEGAFRAVRTADLANRERQSILLLRGRDEAPVLLAPNGRLEFSVVDPGLPTVRDALFADYDHEGDVDLVLATAGGLVLLRNDGLPADDVGAPEPMTQGETIDRSGEPTERITFTDATGPSGLPTAPIAWVRVEDLDADNDVDFLVGTDDGRVLICSNLRRGEFEVRDPSATGLDFADPPGMRDLNRDGLVDLVAADGIHRNLGEMKFAPRESFAAGEGFVLADVDLDGQADLVAANGAAASVRRGSLLVGGGDAEPLPAAPIAGAPPIVADLDFDGDLDLIGAAPAGGLEVYRSGLRPSVGALRVVLEGTKDNHRGLLSLVEVRGASHYERRICRGEPMVFGFDGGDTPEVVRVTWPNGVIQYAILPAAGDPVAVRQKEGLVGSCPFLYVHDGERWRFVSDILGITPLGLPMEAGRFVPPDHDELVRIPGDWLRPVDGEYRLQVTEELREVTYLDRAELWVVDHEAGVEVHPEERFCFPPFPPQVVHALRDVRPMTRVVDQDGRDWTATLATVDGEHAAPFEPLRGQFLGLATPHWLELTLPPEVVDAPRVRLEMTGWFYWTDASVNVASGHDAGHAFVPPILQVPDGAGGFRDAGPPLGFPAGKTKTMVLDVKDLLSADALAAGDLRVRLRSSIRLYWDAIRVAIDDGEADVRVAKLDPIRADLYHRGFSRPLPPRRLDQPERFVFEELMEPRWNQHRGMLTRYGDVGPLLDAIDDRFAVFSAGDAVDLRFDATGVAAPPPGMARTFLLFVDGWAKDDDPNTACAGEVEPLPFHGMSGYPYPATESYPDGPAHREYRATWNTRPGRRLIPSLVPSAADG